MVKCYINESIIIDSPKAVVYQNLINLRLWNKWSPWSCLDPDVKQEYLNNDKSLAWDSKLIGSGKMTIVFADENTIKSELEFYKPFKSRATAMYNIEQLADYKTKVTWIMNSNLPWYMFLFKKLMIAFISKDYKRGLNRLKFLCETGAVRAKLEFEDNAKFIDGVKFAGIAGHSKMDDLASNMTKAFESVYSELHKQENIELGFACTFCDKISFINDTMDYTAGSYFSGDIKSDILQIKNIPKHKAIKVQLTGRYDYLADAWTAIGVRCRALKLKPLKSIPPYEVYVNGPHNTENPDEYITEIYMPIK